MKQSMRDGAEAALDLIRNGASEITNDVILFRRALHSIPEPAFKEEKTQKALAKFLSRLGLKYEKVNATTGIVALIEGGGRKTIALRADMDALPIDEELQWEWKSKHPGYMHACGHDAHMAMVLGAGVLLKRFGRSLPGNVKLIFQPAEEQPPGGAKLLIRKGVLSNPKVGAIIAPHVMPNLEVGKIGLAEGAISAIADDFVITIHGKGGHASSPHSGVDAIVVAAHLITQLQSLVSRRVSAMDNVVVSIGRIEGGSKENVIADKVILKGTVRTKTPLVRENVRAMMRQTIYGVCSSFGARGKLDYIVGYPAVVVDSRLTRIVEDACKKIVEARRVVKTSGFEMGGEDFAYYAQQVPGTIIFVGVGNRKKGIRFPLHHPRFQIDEDALKIGVEALAYSAYRWLSE